MGGFYTRRPNVSSSHVAKTYRRLYPELIIGVKRLVKDILDCQNGPLPSLNIAFSRERKIYQTIVCADIITVVEIFGQFRFVPKAKIGIDFTTASNKCLASPFTRIEKLMMSSDTAC